MNTKLSIPIAAARFISSSLGSQDPQSASAVAKTCLRLVLTVATPVLAIAGLLSPWVGTFLFNNPNTTSLLVTTFTAGFLLDLTTLYGAYFLGLGLYPQVVYQNILYVPLSRGLGLVLAHYGLGVLGIPLGWAIGGTATLLLSLYLWKGRLSQGSSYPVRPLLSFSLPVLASALITLTQSWGDIVLLQALLGQLKTTGAYYLVVSSVGFLSILYIPVTGALLPALSSTHSSKGPEAVSDRLAVTFRLVNITVLPISASLAAVAPTALELVYGKPLAGESGPFALLALTVLLAAQGAILITALQALGNTKPLLKIFLASTILDLAIVALSAKTLGTTAGAAGRIVLAASTLLLAWRSLSPTLHTPITQDLSKAILLAIGTSIPLLGINQLMTHTLQISPLFRLPVILAAFASTFLLVSRVLHIFQNQDFAILENALPKVLHGYTRLVQRLFIRESAAYTGPRRNSSPPRNTTWDPTGQPSPHRTLEWEKRQGPRKPHWTRRRRP